MLFQRPRHSTIRHFPIWLFAAALPMVTLADTNDSSVLVVAQLAEDENVEDVVRSEPRRSPGEDGDASDDEQEPSAPDTDQQTQTVNTVVVPVTRKIAPNIDLKEVAPLPEPEPEPETLPGRNCLQRNFR